MNSSLKTYWPFVISLGGMLIITQYATIRLDVCDRIIRELQTENSRLLDIVQRDSYNVIATMYYAVPYQTDDTPDITADGTKINPAIATEYRYVALSRDLLKRWGGPFEYGDYILVEGAKQFSGVWQVKDTMHNRWTRRLDFLVSVGARVNKFSNVIIKKYRET